MSQEIQLSLTPSPQSLPQQNSSWSGPPSSVVAPPQTLQNSPFAKVHQHLRGRYLITAIVATIFAAGGCIAGLMSAHQGYQSIGLIKIDPVIPSPDMYDKVMPMYLQYVQTVIATLHSERVIKEAMQSREWKAVRHGPPDSYIGEWNKNLLIKTIPNSSIIQVTYTDDGKDAKEVVPVAVAQLIKAYKELYGDEQKNQTERKIDIWKHQQQMLSQKISRDNSLIDSSLQGIGENPQNVLDAKWREQIVLEEKLRDMAEELKNERDELKQAQEHAGPTLYSVEELARVDPAMQETYHIVSQLELDVQDLEKRLGSAHPAVRAAQDKLHSRIAAMNKHRDEVCAKYFIKQKPDGTGGVLVSKDLSVREASLKRNQELYAQEKQFLDELGRRTHDVNTYKAEKQQLDEELVRVTKKIEDLKTQQEMAETFQVVDPGGQAQPANDKRIAFGVLGLMLGGGLPVALLLMASLMNPRFRFSDEATGQPSAGLTLLGILPDLPDRLSDPEQASIAAHCVHQIRTMLQINTGTDERRVFAITSAAPGDGKTSLTLALGLSYAACGTRTLLIDCDLIGAGLTARMNVASPDGVLEAIAHRSLLEYVRNTDIADVSILPVGSGQHLHASTLSPAALRRLIEEAKKHFDTILIDTGPVLGSIEASLVAAAADAVVLTVSRGQQRPLVEKTISHLQHIKANLAGVVFNRAQTTDFEKSISGLSLRSSTSNHGHGTRMGPVARAVQSAFRPAGEEVESN